MRDWDAERAERDANRPKVPEESRTFTYVGRKLVRSERVAAQAIIGLGLAMKMKDEERAATAVTDAILSLLEPKSHDAFADAIAATYPEWVDDSVPEAERVPHPEAGEFIVKQDELMELYQWMLSEASKRPPTQPSGSPTPPQPSGESSTPT